MFQSELCVPSDSVQEDFVISEDFYTIILISETLLKFFQDTTQLV
jgi:hypothetical protein